MDTVQEIWNKTQLYSWLNSSDALFDTIFDIEQDMWARWIGEYLTCKSCDTIYSKDDIYWEKWIATIPLIQRKNTVAEIEQVLGAIPDCPCCEIPLDHIFHYDSYIWEIKNRHAWNNSFLSLSRDDTWKIVWFMDWYIATLEEIFMKEFSFHFSPNVLDYIWEKYKKHKSVDMLTVSSIWTDDKNKSLSRVFSLLEDFFSQFDNSYDSMNVIVESIIWSTTYCIFDLMWAEKMHLQSRPELLLPGKINDKFATDILLQTWAIKLYRDTFNLRARDVVCHSRALLQAA